MAGSNLKKLAALAFFVFLLAVAYWADSGTMPEPFKAISAIPNGDRVGHFVLYGTLAYLVTAAFPSRRVQIAAWHFPLGVVLAVAMATLEEISQVFIPARNADLVDLAAGYLGTLASAFILNMKFASNLPGRGDAGNGDG